MNKAAFLDRDGVINLKAPEGSYITRWDEMQFLPGVVEAIAMLNRAGFLVIVVTNQRCIGKGLITAAELEAMHERMRDDLAKAGAFLDGIYYCPHELQAACACRKPRPGMLLEAASVHSIDLTRSWMIGDSDRDVEAGKRAGCKTVRILESGKTGNTQSDVVAQSLLEASHKISEGENAIPPRQKHDSAAT
jgi:D-glycero-D-manno-heptose 1,7-bisphosphate phosphatase